MLNIIGSNITAVVAAFLAFVANYSVIKYKIATLEKNFEKFEAYKTKIEQRFADGEKVFYASKERTIQQEMEMQSVHDQLRKIDSLKLETKLAEISTELKHIRILVEKNNP